MTIATVLAMAVIDSINPSAIVVTLALLSISESRAVVQVTIYVVAIFVTYFTLGAMMLLGIDALLPFLGGVLRSPAGLITQSLVGLGLLVYSLTASTSRSSSVVVRSPSARTYLALAVWGVSVTALELPTAIPYFAAIALITKAELPIAAGAAARPVQLDFRFTANCPSCWAGSIRRASGGTVRSSPSTAARRSSRDHALGRWSPRGRVVYNGHDRAGCASALSPVLAECDWGGWIGSLPELD